MTEESKESLLPWPAKNQDCGDRGFREEIKFSRRQSSLCLNFAIAHVFAIIGLVLIFQRRVMLSTIIFVEVLTTIAGIGVGVGGHRLLAHRSFKAKTPLRLLLATCFAFSGQQSLWLWTAWHRVHHKLTDTDADPHNSNRGFFYSHIGWLLTYDHTAFVKHLKKVDMSDLESDSIVMFHERYYIYIHTAFVFGIPTLIPYLAFGETFFNSFCIGACVRYCWTSHRTFLVNSAAHLWGYKPYDTSIRPVDNKLIALTCLGEGWHNYHHVFPWDYKAAELGLYRWNLNTAVIDFFAWTGWAYDLKSVSKETVSKRVARTGNHDHLQSGPWGWGDVNIPKENILLTETLYPAKAG